MPNILTRTKLALALLALAATPAFAESAMVQRTEGGVHLQHVSAPQKAQVVAQAEGTRGGNTMYGRSYAAAEQTGVNNGAYRLAAAEQTGVDNGAYRQNV